MNKLRIYVIRLLLMPFSLLYGLIISFINFSYDIGLMKASRFNIPVIGVGNLSIGGTGKTPHIEFLIEMLKDYIDVATLSRGYKRKTSGFKEVTLVDTALTVGDEPLQFKTKYPDISVNVSESRAYAIPQIIMNQPHTQVILLDDSFQHRAVAPGLNILLTAYDNMFTEDYLLPAGRLREWRSGYKRADIIIVTKCPFQMNDEKRSVLINQVSPQKYQKVFFTYFEYGTPYSLYDNSKSYAITPQSDVILLSAIANTQYLETFLYDQVKTLTQIEFTDHHIFDNRDIEKIGKVFSGFEKGNCVIITTEKDAMRLQLHQQKLLEMQIPIFILPAKVKFHYKEENVFEKEIKDYLLSFEA